MMRALWSAASGMLGQQLHIDVISNNIANVNTTGFKKNRVDFEDLMYQNMKRAGTPVGGGTEIPVNTDVGLGVKVTATPKIFTQGDFMKTDNPLDLVIEGNGFFQVTMPDGTTAYTRDGAFKIDSEGRLVSSDGSVLEPEIVIPENATAVSVSESGQVSVLTAGSNDSTEVGQIELARFINPAGLSNLGKNLYKPTGASGDAITGTPGLEGFGTLSQGFLEMSNVQIVEEMVKMIIAQRAYEASSQSIKISDDMLRTANGLIR